ncbi:hypothetical protein Adeg_0749 [Ammonifex degensii KC4]|uniref:CobQ/CobB/MinD/ParA nucleotide binding domain-containing protein n=1 Tax=Ammonifex degensii (strain DSM 10501 / KC4) TaxID=429009 RepID=C9RCB8_AMMDK|nr:hypothetical protein [Ammonifex degensii]ACX51895.1 hypothetical protein Adeg_0749 [Ammonifex degensii KC4]
MRLYVVFGEFTEKLCQRLSSRYEIIGSDRTLEAAVAAAGVLERHPDAFLVLGDALASTLVDGKFDRDAALVRNLEELRKTCPTSRVVLVLGPRASDSLVQEIAKLGIYDIHRVGEVTPDTLCALVETRKTFADYDIDLKVTGSAGETPRVAVREPEEKAPRPSVRDLVAGLARLVPRPKTESQPGEITDGKKAVDRARASACTNSIPPGGGGKEVEKRGGGTPKMPFWQKLFRRAKAATEEQGKRNGVGALPGPATEHPEPLPAAGGVTAPLDLEREPFGGPVPPPVRREGSRADSPVPDTGARRAPGERRSVPAVLLLGNRSEALAAEVVSRGWRTVIGNPSAPVDAAVVDTELLPAVLDRLRCPVVALSSGRLSDWLSLTDCGVPVVVGGAACLALVAEHLGSCPGVRLPVGERPTAGDSTSAACGGSASRFAPPARRGIVLAFYSGAQGFQGKTALAVNTAALLAERGLSVCLVDLDTDKAGLTALCGFSETNPPPADLVACLGEAPPSRGPRRGEARSRAAPVAGLVPRAAPG